MTHGSIGSRSRWRRGRRGGRWWGCSGPGWRAGSRPRFSAVTASPGRTMKMNIRIRTGATSGRVARRRSGTRGTSLRRDPRQGRAQPSGHKVRASACALASIANQQSAHVSQAAANARKRAPSAIVFCRSARGRSGRVTRRRPSPQPLSHCDGRGAVDVVVGLQPAIPPPVRVGTGKVSRSRIVSTRPGRWGGGGIMARRCGGPKFG